ncbi:MAG: hypothetical protein Q4P08_05000 [Eubacteriales bacterium]|nr:hypothetical protein [Eubacteriales bacterium]
MRALHKKIRRLLSKVDFEALWPGFKVYPFALYNHERVCFADGEIPWNQSFLGNTSIEYDGRLIAIWSVEDEAEQENIERLTANIVHEMFHAWQKEREEKRYPDDLALLIKADDCLFYELKLRENEYLAKAYNEANLSIKKELLLAFARLRQSRLLRFPAATKEEALVESLEGTAEFVGSSALQQLAPGDFDMLIASYLANLERLDRGLFDLRRKAYFSGTVLLHIANELGLEFNPCPKDNDLTIFEMLFPDIDAQEIDFEARAEISELFSDYQSDLAEEIQAIEKKTKLRELDARICGYDPMNMERLGDDLICRNFVMIKSGDKQQFIEGAVVLKMKPKDPYKLWAYRLEDSQ